MLFERCLREMVEQDFCDCSTVAPHAGEEGVANPAYSADQLTSKLTDWFHTEGHPLYRLMDDFVRVFHASYKGSGAHVLLLGEATDEVC